MAGADIYTRIPDRRDSQVVRGALGSIIAEAQTGGSNASERDAVIRAIIDDLADQDTLSVPSSDPTWKSWETDTYETALECLKILSRTPAGSSHLATPIGISTLIFHAERQTDDKPTNTRGTKSQQLAVSALCNVLLLHQSAPELCVSRGLGDWAVQQLKSEDSAQDDEVWLFLMGRLVMVLTSRASYGFLGNLVDELNGLQVIKSRLADTIRHAERSQLAIVEYMKILYHIFALYPETQDREWDHRFDEFSPIVIDLLVTIPTKELLPPLTNVINVLTRFSPAILQSTVTTSRLLEAATKVFAVTVSYVRQTLPPPPWKPGDAVPSPEYRQDHVETLDQVLPPPLLALVNLINASPQAKRQIKGTIIPADLDRSVGSDPLEERSDILGHMLRLSRSAMNPVTAAAVGEVLWVICDENASTLSDEIGYGNAAGILFHKGMSLPAKPEARVEEIPDEPTSLSDADDHQDLPRNPITGLVQTEDDATHPMADMGEDEKEREAERMMALFDRMARNPTMQLAENPMKEAVRSGKMDEWEQSEHEKELENIRRQEEADEAEAAKEIADWKRRMGKPT